MSHIKCIELAIEEDKEHMFICEDDISFTDAYTLKRNIKRFNDNIWDIIY